MRITFDVDSGERDAQIWPNPNSYEVPLKTPIYDVSELQVASVRLPVSNFAIHDFNNRFSLKIDAGAPDAGTHVVTMADRNYPNGTTLAAKILTAIAATGCTTVDNVEWRSTRDSLKFSNVASAHEFTLLFRSGVDGYDSNVMTRTTPNQVFGMPALDLVSSNSIIDLEGRVDFTWGPKTYVVKLTAGSDVLGQTVYTSTPFYTGVFMSTGTWVAQYVDLASRDDDTVTHRFVEGPYQQMDSLKIQWFYKENNKMVPCDFRQRDHAIKFSAVCETDRLKTLSRKVETTSFDVPEPIRMPEFADDSYDWVAYLPIVFVLLTGFILIRSLSGSR
tara:strand:- start:1988 stop:2983 length:996 start_codon:yes stop_codon:yes gene_type:complete